MTDEQVGAAAGRAEVLSLIDFLGAYDARRNPPVRDIAQYQLYRLAAEAVPVHDAVVVHPSDETWLAVDFLDLPPAPTVPDDVAPWLETGGEVTAAAEPVVLPPPEPVTDPATDPIDLLGGVSDETRAWERGTATATAWIDDVWQPWAAERQRVVTVKALHRDLFETRERLVVDRDTLELVWGFGRVRWDVGAGPELDRVAHPMLTVPVEVDLDPESQQIRVRPAGPPEVESRYLQGLDLHDRNGLLAVRQAVTADGAQVWLPDELTELLRRLVRALDDEGVVVSGPVPVPATPAVDTGWTLFLRRQVPDAQGFLDDMRELYGRNEAVPAPLLSIVAPSDAEFAAGGAGDAGASAAPSEALLLPLASNEEQERILEYAQRHPGVIVQGPPGTGKSHTIANLISHHVAYGRKVLVVAEKEQSLKVLADKVPAEIRDLIVSVLGADEEGRRKVEAAINGIQSGVARIDPGHSDREIARLTEELDGIDRGLAATRTAFLRARQAEIATLPGTWSAGTEPTPQTAAGWLAAHPQYDTIPDRITVDDRMPDPRDFVEMLDLLGRLGVERAGQAIRALPDPATLPDVGSLRNAFTDVARAGAAAGAARSRITDWDRAVAAGPATAEQVLADLRDEADWRTQAETSWTATLLARLEDPLQAAEWQRFAADLARQRARVMELRPDVRAHDVQLPPDRHDELGPQLEQAHQKLTTGGKLGLFAKEARKGLERCTVDGHVPATAAEVRLCLDALEIETLRRRIAVQWVNQTGGVAEGLAVGPAEETVRAPLTVVEQALAAAPRWAAIGVALRTLGMGRVGSPSAAELAELTAAVEQLVVHFRTQGATRWLADVARPLVDAGRDPEASPLSAALAADLADRDPDGWQRHLAEVVALRAVAAPARRLLALVAVFRSLTPVWVQRILADPTAAGDPLDFENAWQWRQLESWIATVTDQRTPAQLQAELTELLATRTRTVTRLVSERAWRRLSTNLGQRERQALTEYMKAASRYGKTGGKFAQRWINEMRVALDKAKTAVPVWIMPTAKALTSFRPAAEPPFDVLIVDEASQIGFNALPLLSLARTAIIVGDDKQTSPENVGLDRQQVFDMMDDHLRDLPGYKVLLDPDNSLYDLALQRFSTPIMLTEHFRCLPEIIAFSNRVAYENKIIPLRDQPPAVGWSPLGLVRVLDGYRVGDLNEPEAQQVVALIQRLCADPLYDGMGFGVVSLLGTTQAGRIKELLYDRLGPKVYDQRRIRCGDAATFQGDERDVMVISTVVAVDPTGARRIGSMTSGRDLRRINVAASRAQHQMWVVTSVDATDLPAGDLRAELIRHCSAAAKATELTGDLIGRCESDFERRVVGMILARGYRGYRGVEVQRVVGRYRIDVVVHGPERRLAVECDGDRWHGEDVWHRDRARQEVLERAGWEFERIRGSAFYRDPDAALAPLWAHLERLGIPTGDEWMSVGRPPTVIEVSGPVGAAPREPLPTNDSPAAPAPEQESESESESAPEPAPAPLTEPETVSVSESPRPDVDLPGPVTDPPVIDAPVIAPPGVDAPDIAPPVRSAAAVSAVVREYLVAQISGPPGYKDRMHAISVPAPVAPANAPPVLASPTRPTPASPVGESPVPAPFRAWTPSPVPAVASGDAAGITAGLAAIVAAEGPMHSEALYRRYVQATGGLRVGRESRRTLDQLTLRAVRTGVLERIRDAFSATGEATLYTPGTAPVVIRERGPRTLYEIPRSEIAAVIDHLGLDGSDVDATRRAVLEFFGFGRLTAAAVTYLDSCLDHPRRP